MIEFVLAFLIIVVAFLIGKTFGRKTLSAQQDEAAPEMPPSNSSEEQPAETSTPAKKSQQKTNSFLNIFEQHKEEIRRSIQADITAAFANGKDSVFSCRSAYDKLPFDTTLSVISEVVHKFNDEVPHLKMKGNLSTRRGYSYRVVELSIHNKEESK